MEFSVVRTPKRLGSESKLSQREIGRLLNDEFRNHSCWTETCTTMLIENPHIMFLYDRFEFVLGQAYGNSQYKIALNPLMVVCYHPDCILKKTNPIVKLRHLFDLNYFIMHLMGHQDALGKSMMARFSAVSTDTFMAVSDLDKVSISPFTMNPSLVIPKRVVASLESYGISRKLSVNYICHWKSKLIESGVVKSNSLTFQEDEAMINSVLCYPNPVRDWSLWSTIAFYSLKLYTSVSATALSLYRGVTRLRTSGSLHSSPERRLDDINHAAPSVNTIQGMLPHLDFESEQFHASEVLFHIKVLEKVGDRSLKLCFEGITRYMVTLGIDEQEINQGTFIHNDHLYGLKNVLSALEVSEITLTKFPEYIGEKNGFITSVREYRLTDFAGIFCSNVYTSFESACLDSTECAKALKKVANLSKSCQFCIRKGLECHYSAINAKCGSCAINGVPCVSLVVFHVLWDMGSAHKKTDKDFYTIDSESTPVEMMSSELFTIGFGGLHLAKAIVNTSRNHVLTFNGQNFGINILRAYKADTRLACLKNAVFVGKDRQSDYLSYMTTGQVVQHALREIGAYTVVRVPEPMLTYTENSKSQVKMRLPVAIATNLNGDVFVLDSASSCVHGVDR